MFLKQKHKFPWEPPRLATPHRLTLLKAFHYVAVEHALYVCGCAHAGMGVGLRGRLAGSVFPSATTWVAGPELRSSDLVASVLPTEPSPQARLTCKVTDQASKVLHS